ncbi:SEPSECS [Lepeophtheirus salmonis]|uniref:O-phosphoseryl-tRNA(Sec) selenium transferase n=1 Tax=Lepeophtheirus salmonis TaxID=72036 RepID=A0A7R8CL24_LEPSM|nr:SEPSECS [Lepeophtheirus salmonis]CAF2849641.1 SEPSECS [Lepeophtheirus salmonis]
MNEKAFSSSMKWIPETYVNLALEAKKSRESKITHLIQQRKVPDEGWNEEEIETLLREWAMMDTNNFSSNVGAGEREARIYSKLVYRRHFGAGHGIGRSGDLTEVQPKAAGSSLMNKITNGLILDIIRQSGIRSATDCFLVPVATGMALTLCLLSFRHIRGSQAKYVIWSRIDQKSCFKSISTAGFIPVVIELTQKGDELNTSVTEIESSITEIGPENIAAIMTTTSCFAPRGPDDIPTVAKLCQRFAIPHLVNNAYGIQSSKCMHLIEESHKTGGRIDAFVQSTDKNFMVPVGGAVISGFDKSVIGNISKTYPGRASSTPSTDVFITLISMGMNEFKNLLKVRKDNFVLLKSLMNNSGDGKSVSDLGSKLFIRGISGARVVTGKGSKVIDQHEFLRWGSHSDDTSVPYLTAAVAIGMTKEDVYAFIKKLDKVLETKMKKL